MPYVEKDIFSDPGESVDSDSANYAVLLID